jgi:hypothetical protein
MKNSCAQTACEIGKEFRGEKTDSEVNRSGQGRTARRVSLILQQRSGQPRQGESSVSSVPDVLSGSWKQNVNANYPFQSCHCIGADKWFQFGTLLFARLRVMLYGTVLFWNNTS